MHSQNKEMTKEFLKRERIKFTENKWGNIAIEGFEGNQFFINYINYNEQCSLLILKKILFSYSFRGNARHPLGETQKQRR